MFGSYGRVAPVDVVVYAPEQEPAARIELEQHAPDGAPLNVRIDEPPNMQNLEPRVARVLRVSSPGQDRSSRRWTWLEWAFIVFCNYFACSIGLVAVVIVGTIIVFRNEPMVLFITLLLMLLTLFIMFIFRRQILQLFSRLENYFQ